MCCFSRNVQSVSATQIFARDATVGYQFLVYQMSYSASEELAMVLPLPVPAGTADNAVRFINLAGYPEFFADLKSGFPEPPALKSKSIAPRGMVAAAAPLQVVAVGSFEASFVPTLKDFERLDPRFRMPGGIWDQLPSYKGYGFAVFKLQKDAHSVHPMAFTFPRRGQRLFLPTVHVHDGQLHKSAHFDHSLYCQVGAQYGRIGGWTESPQPVSAFADSKKSQAILDANHHCYLKNLRGELKNEDTWV